MNEINKANAPSLSFQDHVYSVVADLRDQERWASLEGKELLQLLYHGICIYGATNDESMVPLLMPVYTLAMDVTDMPARLEMYTAVKSQAEEGGLSINAYMPFLLQERDPAIVSTATIDVAMTGHPQEDDVLAWPRAIVSYLQQGMPTNRGAVLGGLVLLGDRRVNALLEDVKWTLSDSEVKTAATRHSAFAQLAAFEFWLSWTEQLMEKGLGETAFYAHCASALALLIERTQTGVFIDGERNFGYMHRGEDCLPGAVFEQLSVAEVGTRFAERLYAIEAAELPPKVMSHVLLQYGLEPRAAVQDRYVIQ